MTSLVFNQYLESPDELLEKYEFAIDELALLIKKWYVLLDVLGAAYPGEVNEDADIPDDVYVVDYLFNMVESILGFFADFQIIVVPVWYSTSLIW